VEENWKLKKCSFCGETSLMKGLSKVCGIRRQGKDNYFLLGSHADDFRAIVGCMAII